LSGDNFGRQNQQVRIRKQLLIPQYFTNKPFKLKDLGGIFRQAIDSKYRRK